MHYHGWEEPKKPEPKTIHISFHTYVLYSFMLLNSHVAVGCLIDSDVSRVTVGLVGLDTEKRIIDL